MDRSARRAMIRTKGYRATTLLAAAAALGAPAAAAQQVLEIDTAAGRVIIDDEWRAISTIDEMALDRNRAILYVSDAEEPEGVMAFSIETGEWIRTIQTPTGDGPYELSRGMTGLAIGPDGGLYVSGFVRVLEFDLLGSSVSNWRPQAEVNPGVCDFDGQPAIPALDGVIRRGPGGTDESIGPGEVAGGVIDDEATLEEIESTYLRMYSARIACTAKAAYVVLSYEGSPDSVFVYHRSGEMGRLMVPTEFTVGREDCKVTTRFPSGETRERQVPCQTWNRRLRPSFDDGGDLVLFGSDTEVSGAIVDPETGCYAVVRKQGPSRTQDAFFIYRDSALVLGYDFEQTIQGNTTRTTIHSTANRVSLHPLRRVSGDPCPGMLPSVEDVG